MAWAGVSILSPGCPDPGKLGRDWCRNMNSNKFPFLRFGNAPLPSFPYFNSRLEPPDSCSTTVHTKPFSTSTIQFLFGLFATSTKICTQRSFQLPINLPLLATLLPAYLYPANLWAQLEYKSTIVLATSIFRTAFFDR